MVAGNFVNEEEQKKFTIKDNVIIGNPKANEEKCGLAKLILDSLTKHPDFVGQVNANTGVKRTFSEIKDRSVRCALWLQKQGVGKNDVVCVSTPHHDDDAIPCLATFYIGAILNPWYHELTPVVTRRFFELMHPKVVFADPISINLLSKVSREAGQNPKFVVLGNHPDFPTLTQLMSQQSPLDIANFEPCEPENPKNQLGAIFFSSGTTGNQKGTMLSYDTLVNHRMEHMHVRQGMSALWYSSLSWITGTNLMTTCLRMRITRVIHDEFDVEETSRVVGSHKVNFVFFTPSMLTRLCKAKVYARHDYSSLETFVTGGSKSSKAVLEETRKALPHTLVSNSYGMSELGGLTCLQSRKITKIDSIGQIVEGVRMKIIDPKTGRLLGPNQEGELCFTLDNLMLGYWKNPEETRKMIDDEGWLHTGDLGYYDENGEISITDRSKEVIITQNYHVSPSQIEGILLKHPEVADAAVVPVPHQIDVERPLAFVVKCPKAEVKAEELRDLPAVENEYFRLTGGVVFVDKIPYTTTGKKHLRELKEMAKAYAQ